MNRKNKYFLSLFLLALFGVVNSAYLKLEGNSKAEMMMIMAMILELTALLGLFFTNFRKIITFLS